MWNKYCKKLHPIVARGIGAPQVWKEMISVRKEVEHEIWWQIKSGNSNFSLIIVLRWGHCFPRNKFC